MLQMMSRVDIQTKTYLRETFRIVWIETYVEIERFRDGSDKIVTQLYPIEKYKAKHRKNSRFQAQEKQT